MEYQGTIMIIIYLAEYYSSIMQDQHNYADIKLTCMQSWHGLLLGIVKVAKAQKNTDDVNDYYLKSEGTNEQQNHTA